MVEQTKSASGMWAVAKKEGGIIILCGFIARFPGRELCYIIQADYQGYGFGSEAALALTKIALWRFGHVTATIRNTNVASLRVAAKVGLKPSTQSFSSDPDLLLFAFD